MMKGMPRGRAAFGAAAPPPTPGGCMMAAAAPSFAAPAPSPAAAAGFTPPAMKSASASQPPSQPSSSAASATTQPRPDIGEEEAFDVGGSVELDYTKIPAELDAKLAAQEGMSALRPTKIAVQPDWKKRTQLALLGEPSTSTLRATEQEREKRRAFDLLDALSRSGALPIDCCSLHVLIAATHCFDSSLIDTVIVKNVNPIEKLESSMLLVSETIQAIPARRLVRPDAFERVVKYSAPTLLGPEAGAQAAQTAADE